MKMHSFGSCFLRHIIVFITNPISQLVYCITEHAVR